MKRFILFAVAIALSSAAIARPTTFDYSLDTNSDCEGQPISIADYAGLELYVSSTPIPASDVPCPEPGQGDTPPAGLTPYVANANDNSVTIDIIPGTYYVRARAQHTNGDWSNLSLQQTWTIPDGPLRAPVLIRINF